MYNFDDKDGILFMGKLDNRFKFEPYKDSDHYVAFNKYLYSEPAPDGAYATLRGDLNTLAAAINERIKQTDIVDPHFQFIVTDIRENDTNTTLVGERHTINTVVLGKFKTDRFESNEYELCKLIQVDRFGLTRYNNGTYAVSATSEPSKYITLEGKNRLNIMLNAVKFDISGNKDVDKVITTIARNKVQLNTLIFMLAYRMRNIKEDSGIYPKFSFIKNVYTDDVPDVVDLLTQIITPGNVLWSYKYEDEIPTWAIVGNKRQKVNDISKYDDQIFGMFGMIKYGITEVSPYALNDVRRQLNELLSINRGLDKTLSRDIYNKDGQLVASKGRMVTREIIDDLNYYRINRYYVRANLPNLEGAQLALDVGVTRIPAGTYIPEEVLLVNRQLVNVDKLGRLLADTTFQQSSLFVIPENTRIDSQLISFIEAIELFPYMITFMQIGLIRTTQVKMKATLGMDLSFCDTEEERAQVNFNAQIKLPMTNTKIPVKKKDQTGKFSFNNTIYIVLEEEIIGNQHFYDAGKWTYVSQTTGEEAEPSPFLTIYDLAALLSLVPRIAQGNYINLVSDRDFGLRKKICLVDEHLHKAFRKIRDRAANVFYSSYRAYINTQNPQKFENASKNLSYIWVKELYGDRLKVMSLVDRTNPAAYVSFINRVNTITKDKRGVSDKMRLLALGFYGRLCPYETPASSKLGLTNTKAVHATIKNGSIYADYYKVVRRGGKSVIDFSKVYSFSVMEEEQYTISDITAIDFLEDGTITSTGAVLARVPSSSEIEKHVIENVPIELVQYVNCYPDETLSPTATTIPYIGSNDPVRVSYGLSMARQTRPLPYREVPTVMTNAFYDMVRYTTMFQINAEDDGEVVAVIQSNKDALRSDTYVDITVRYDHKINNYGSANSEADYERTYEVLLVEYSYSSVILRYIDVVEGQRVRKGDVLVSSNFTKDGYMATGVDALVAEIPVGFNYEDGVQVSRLFDKKMTSYGHTDDEFELTEGQKYAKEKYLQYIDSNATPVVNIYDTKLMKNTPFLSNDLRGYIVRIKRMDKGRRKNTKIRKWKIDAISLNQMTVGDKMANRHGNKGVVPRVVDNTDQFCLNNGEIIDVCYNPAGVGSRMNLGQIKEMHIGLACKVLSIKVCIQAFNDLDWNEAKKLLYYAYDCANKGVDAANSDPAYSMYPQSLKRWVKEHEMFAENWRGVFDKNGRAYIINPITGQQTRKPVVIGYNYIYKLVQEVDEKVNARGSMASGVPYVTKHARPTRGANQDGGQSYGHMEMDALLCYGASHFVHELQNERGDNPYLRQLDMMNLLGTENDMLPEDLKTLYDYNERRSVEYLKSVFTALGVKYQLDGFEPGSGLVDSEPRENSKKFIYSSNAVLGYSRPLINKEAVEEEETRKEEMIRSSIDIEDDD